MHSVDAECQHMAIGAGRSSNRAAESTCKCDDRTNAGVHLDENLCIDEARMQQKRGSNVTRKRKKAFQPGT